MRDCCLELMVVHLEDLVMPVRGLADPRMVLDYSLLVKMV